jgi:spermidine synthase
VTRWRDDVRLFLNNNLQFSSADEYRYHEALVHPGMSSFRSPRRVLILGGGDGLALREVLKYPSVDSVTLVDLDPAITRLFSTNELLRKVNGDSLLSSKVKVVNQDAFVWLNENSEFFDFAVVDFPDPTNYALGKLYTTAFFKMLKEHLSYGGAAVVQSTSPLYARKSYWCIAATLQSAGFQTNPYHAYVPSFGEWGFILASNRSYVPPTQFPAGLKFITAETTRGLFQFPPDMAQVDAEVNRLNNQILVQYYESEWRQVEQ